MDKGELMGEDGAFCDECKLPQDEIKQSEFEGSEWQKKISVLEEEIGTLKDTLLRKIAESENLKKRMEKEQHDAVAYSNTKFAKDLLKVLDNFDLVVKNSKSIEKKIIHDESLKAVFDGVEICGREMVSVFRKHGIKKIDVSEGTVFNPQYHEAMSEMESETVAPGSVIGVFQAGYTYHDRLLRPAMVSVSKK